MPLAPRRNASSPPAGSHWWSHWGYPLFLLLAVAVVFGQICRHDFVIWDDNAHIVYNPYFQPVSWQNTLRFWREPYFNLYVPVSYTVFAAEAWLAQSAAENGRPSFNAGVFHAGSLLLHAACVLLVYHLLKRLTNNAQAALLGALLFGLHPLQVESVAWASETRGLLASFFSLLGILAWLRFAQSGGWTWYVLALLAFAVALLCKPSGVIAPIVVAVLSLAWLRVGWRWLAVWISPCILLVLLSIIITRLAQPAEAMDFVPPVWARPLIAADALQFYLGKIFLPLNLAAHYDRSPQAVMRAWWFPYCWIVPVLLTALLVWRPRRALVTAAGLFAGALLPVLGLIPFGYQDYSTVADRYAYLAMLGPALLAACWICGPRGRLASLVLTAAMLLCAALSFVQAARWRNTETLFTHVLAIHPHSQVARDNYSAYLNEQSRHSEALKLSEESLRLHPHSAVAHSNHAAALEGLNRTAEAVSSRQLAIKYDPKDVSAHIALGNVLTRLDRLQEAETHYRDALAREPQSMLARYNLALLLQKQGRFDEAMSQFEQVLARHPDDYNSRLTFGLLLARSGQWARAEEQFLYLVQTTGDLPARVQLAEAVLAQGRIEDAYAHYREALREPSAAWPQIAGRVAWLMSTHPDAKARDGLSALRLAQEACRQTNHQRPALLRSLAAAHAEKGEFGPAEEIAGRAQQAARSLNDSRRAELLAADLDRYRSNLPVRQPPTSPSNSAGAESP